jgi:hypothetical protein
MLDKGSEEATEAMALSASIFGAEVGQQRQHVAQSAARWLVGSSPMWLPGAARGEAQKESPPPKWIPQKPPGWNEKPAGSSRFRVRRPWMKASPKY